MRVDSAAVVAASCKVKIKALNFPPELQAVKIIEAESAREKAAELVRVLHEESKII